MTPVKRGAPTKRTESRRQKVLEALELGLSFEQSARVAGICENSLIAWRKADAAFSADVDNARAKLEQRMLQNIDIAARDPKHWTAAAWLLERLFPDRYRRPAALEITGRNGAPVAVESTLAFRLDLLTVEELQQLAAGADTLEAKDV